MATSPTSAAPGTDSLTPRRIVKGKGLGWSAAENLALCKAILRVGRASDYGAGMKQSHYFRRVHDSFKADTELRPVSACSTTGTGCALDRRRWEGRSAVSCGKQWAKIRTACTRYMACERAIANRQLDATPIEVARCTLALYNRGEDVAPFLEDVLRNPHYIVGKPFPFTACYNFLVKHDVLSHFEERSNSASRTQNTSTQQQHQQQSQQQQQASSPGDEDADQDHDADPDTSSAQAPPLPPALPEASELKDEGAPVPAPGSSALGLDVSMGGALAPAPKRAVKRRRVSESDADALAASQLRVEESRLELRKYELLLGANSCASAAELQLVRGMLIQSLRASLGRKTRCSCPCTCGAAAAADAAVAATGVAQPEEHPAETDASTAP